MPVLLDRPQSPRLRRDFAVQGNVREHVAAPFLRRCGEQQLVMRTWPSNVSRVLNTLPPAVT
jgi:hypothetical protein